MGSTEGSNAQGGRARHGLSRKKASHCTASFSSFYIYSSVGLQRSNTMDSTLQGAFIGAAATICASIIGYRALRKPEQGQTVITVLPDRLAVFKEARKLVESAQCTVVDTTWGSSEENFLPAEKVALNEYLSAKDIAVKNPKLDYREIFTEVPDDEHRTKRIEAEQKRQSPLDRYSARETLHKSAKTELVR